MKVYFKGAHNLCHRMQAHKVEQPWEASSAYDFADSCRLFLPEAADMSIAIEHAWI